MRLISRLLAALVVLGFAPIATADILTVTLSNQNDIVIPVFTGSGTLNSVNLSITLRAGTTSGASPASQNHGGAKTILSDNIASGTFNDETKLTFNATNVTSSSGGAGQTVSTVSYNGGGITVGSFDIVTSAVTDHAHNLATSGANLIVVPGAIPNPATTQLELTLTPDSQANPEHAYSSVVKSLSFSSPASLAPFLGPGPINIAAGSFATPSASHLHTYSFMVQYIANPGDPFSNTTFNFLGNLDPDGHTHLIDPTFDIEASFDFTPFNAVPEPSTILLSSLALGGIVVRRFRRKQK